MNCRQCKKEYNGRKNSKFCSVACKQKAYRIAQKRTLLNEFEYLDGKYKQYLPDGNSVLDVRIHELKEQLKKLEE